MVRHRALIAALCAVVALAAAFAIAPAAAQDCVEGGDPATAIKACSALIGREPNNAEAYFNRAWAYSERKNHQAAIRDYTKAIEIDPKGARYYAARGAVHAGANANPRRDTDRALADLAKAIELDPDNARAHDTRCQVYVARRDKAQATAACQKALSLDPFNAVAKRFLNSVGVKQ